MWKLALIAAAFVVTGCAAGDKASADSTGTAYEPFEKAVEQYWKLRKDAAKKAPGMPDQATPEQIAAHKQQLRELLQQARANARQGDVFVPSVRDELVRAVRVETRGADGKTAKKTIMEENPAAPDVPGTVKLVINGRYPPGTPRTTLPPTLLLRLPTLRKGLEYRFVGRALILEDIEAAMIIDYLPNALPGGSGK